MPCNRVWCFAILLSQSILISAYSKALPLTARNDKFTWGVIGGSWATGVTFDLFGTTDLDSNQDECLRANYSFAALLRRDDSWIPDQQEQDLRFAACAHSMPEHIFSKRFGSRRIVQQSEMGYSYVTFLQLGLNEWKLANVLNDCIFQNDDKNYGPKYPARDGECAKSLAKARADIEGGESSGVQHEIHGMIYSWWDYMTSKSFKDVRLYVIGYADFFNTIEDATMCNNITFAQNAKEGQKLVTELRKEINNLVQLANDKLRKDVEIINNGDKRVNLGFIDINPAFDASRFCEGGHSEYDQYFGEKVKFWNRVPDRAAVKIGLNYQFHVPTDDERKHWVETRSFTNTTDEIDTLTWTQNHATKNLTFPGPKQDGTPGVVLRTFLPNVNGHSAIASIIKERVKKDLVSPPPPPPESTTLAAPAPTSPPDPHMNKQALHIALRWTARPDSTHWNLWTFYVSDIAQPGDGCGNLVLEDGFWQQESPWSLKYPPWPSGTFKMEFQITNVPNQGNAKCRYFNNGQNPGMLRCTGIDYDIPCFEDTNKADGDGWEKCSSTVRFHPAVYCEF